LKSYFASGNLMENIGTVTLPTSSQPQREYYSDLRRFASESMRTTLAPKNRPVSFDIFGPENDRHRQLVGLRNATSTSFMNAMNTHRRKYLTSWRRIPTGALIFYGRAT
jgi:hypothetical protein